MRSFNKIFGVGLNKTGTTSLAAALEILGVPCLHHTHRLRKVLSEERQKLISPPLSLLPEFKAFCDHPIEKIYPELDLAYPGSLFICTLRDKASWIESRRKHVLRNRSNSDYHGAWITIDEEAWSKEFDQHKEKLTAYFHGRDDLLYLDLFGGDGYAELCEFLRCGQPDEPFPRENDANSITKNYRGFRGRLSRLLKRLKRGLRGLITADGPRFN